MFTNVSDSKTFGRERQLLSVHACCVLFCVNSARACSVSDTREPPERANTWSMSNYLSWQVTLAIIHLYWIYILEYRCTDQQDIYLFYFRASSVPCLHTNCTVGTRARHTYIVCTQYIHTHTIVWALTTLENGTSDTCSLIAWSIDVKNYIARGPFVTASQTTQNNKPKLTERCTPQSASLPPSRPVSH